MMRPAALARNTAGASRPPKTSSWTSHDPSSFTAPLAPVPPLAPVAPLAPSRAHRGRRAALRAGKSLARRGAPRANTGGVLRLRDRRRRRARPLPEGARVSKAPRGANGSRPLSGTWQDDDGERILAGDDQLTRELEEARSARRD